MRIVLFYHSLVSDWNHGNAHFLRGIVSELTALGHDAIVYEPADGWSRKNLLADCGERALAAFARAYPGLASRLYDPSELDVAKALDGADLVLVHEWNDPALVRRIGEYRASTPALRALFHDTHHRLATDPASISAFDLSRYDGVLAYGRAIADLYRERGLAARVWTWHEAADVRVFKPISVRRKDGDLVWIGNWGDGERTEELDEFLFRPARELGLTGRVHGVRYPEDGLTRLAEAGLVYAGWLPNFKVPEVFARHRVTVHIPRRPYATALPGIPTIRVFEALACGIPLVCAPWDDAEGLFSPGKDYLVAQSGSQMKTHLRAVLHDQGLAQELSRHGRETILARHTCAHRVRELMAVCAELGLDATSPKEAANA